MSNEFKYLIKQVLVVFSVVFIFLLLLVAIGIYLENIDFDNILLGFIIISFSAIFIFLTIVTIKASIRFPKLTIIWCLVSASPFMLAGAWFLKDTGGILNAGISNLLIVTGVVLFIILLLVTSIMFLVKNIKKKI